MAKLQTPAFRPAEHRLCLRRGGIEVEPITAPLRSRLGVVTRDEMAKLCLRSGGIEVDQLPLPYGHGSVQLRVTKWPIVANGYFDLATPFFATEYTFSHMALDPDVRAHVSMDFFDAEVRADLAKFIAGAVPTT